MLKIKAKDCLVVTRWLAALLAPLATNVASTTRAAMCWGFARLFDIFAEGGQYFTDAQAKQLEHARQAAFHSYCAVNAAAAHGKPFDLDRGCLES